MATIAWTLAFLLRFDFSLEMLQSIAYWQVLLILLPIYLIISWGFGLYRGVWRFASISDLWNIIRVAVINTVLLVTVLFLINRVEGVPRSSLALYPLLLIFLLGSPRLLYRVWRDRSLRNLSAVGSKRVIILGAGQAGELIAREMLRGNEYLPLAFLDDEPRLRGSKVHGLPVLGGIQELSDCAEKMSVELVVIATATATGAQMRKIVEYCEHAGIPFRTLPNVADLVSGRAEISSLREVSIDDLLGRDPVSLNRDSIAGSITGKSVMVTGAGGSIGSELCRQILLFDPARLVVFDNSEFNLYQIDRELTGKYPDIDLHTVLGDVCDNSAIEHCMSEHHPQVIFHAAAYKHVPLLQHQARQAVRNNILGTRNMALVADKYGCDSFIMISTDKAVNPTNNMGASKRIAEIFCQNLNQRSKTRYITVRFGNVLGSAGSVVPLFKEQIAKGGPVTVTHPEITRYFMTIPEACQLILQAAVQGEGGEIFVLDMGEPVKIAYLAEQMIILSGKRPGEDIEIKYTGLRPGEKLYEELFHEQEQLSATTHEKILLAKTRIVDWEQLQADFAAMQAASEAFDEPKLEQLIKKLVPEMTESSATGNVIHFDQVKKLEQ
ncbi:polysaccharide biosynthesis protein [Sulfuriflexus mobilis]|uniref:polysaccharide biosynthesis protein n=1 Tax=Sulfuriflexus mobilis TaxID=1811807 RepID=UPI001E5D34BE|nr:nucleoside-diphosphate sugar epimerase/dehydratase [Sulfuriflexus mobilis]